MQETFDRGQPCRGLGDHDHHRGRGRHRPAIGGFATELFEIRDSARRAGRDHDVDPVVEAVVDPEADQTDD